MQPTENFSVPRRPLDVEDYIDIARRHKGWIFGPFLLTVVASVVGVYLWPDSYESTAVIKIQPQQVPQNMVQSSISQDISDRITSMATTVLSRNVLTAIINDMDLYPAQRKRMPIDDVVEMMRKDIQVTPVMAAGSNGRNVPAFTVQFKYDNRVLASKVVTSLVQRFTSEDINNRSNAASGTTRFLKDQADQAKKEMDDLEEKLSKFRLDNNGRLPDQVGTNTRQLETLQVNYQFLTSSKTRADLDKLTIETNLRVEEGRKAEMSKAAGPGQPGAPVVMKSERLLAAERDVQNVQDALSVALQSKTEAHPDVQNLRGRLTVAKNRRDEIEKEDAASKAATPATVAGPNRQLQMQLLEIDGNIQRYQSAIRAKDLEIADLQAKIKLVEGAIDKVQKEISSAPLGEQQYGDLTRERDLAKARYIDLANRLSAAELSQDLESRGQGEKLELLDPPSLPQNPTEPKRPMVIGMGAGLGLLLGVVIAAAREMKDTSLKNLKDVRAYTQMAILGSVPLLENDFVVRRRRRMAWLGWTAACLMAVVTVAGSIVYYYSQKI
jgi:polysaccharide chain length determinant protein (PEP-CTERM system associated)